MSDFLHLQGCAICRTYATHISGSGQPPAWALVLGQCERLRAQRNEATSTISELRREKATADDLLESTKKRLEYYQNENVKLRLELDFLKASTDHSSMQGSSGVNTAASPVSPPQPPSPRNNRGPQSIAQAKELMAAAHRSGNSRALKRVKVLCAEAHNTPRDEKTPIQNYLLTHWRNPEGAGRNPIHEPHLKSNPRRDDPVEIWYDYLCTHQISWPRGVRRDNNNRPFLPDLKASRIVAQLRPNDTENEAAAAMRFDFMQVVADIFERRGLYQSFLERHQIFVPAVANLRPYSSPPPITIESVVRHFAECGVTVQEANGAIEPWARSYKLSRESD